MVTFIELGPFASVREKYLDDEEFWALQRYLIENPDAGSIVPRSGGCRKLRWSGVGRGKRGGIRVIYFVRPDPLRIILVTMYAKNVRDNIDPELLRRLKEVFENG
jgi:mRNA-degrading endonuclease RelE of RelBE toxin-antitoxin system